MEKVAVYIPATDDGKGRDEITRTKMSFGVLYGGYTSLPASGGWKDGEFMVEEEITVVYSFTEHPNIVQLRDQARSIARTLKQTKVAIEHSGTMEFVTI